MSSFGVVIIKRWIPSLLRAVNALLKPKVSPLGGEDIFIMYKIEVETMSKKLFSGRNLIRIISFTLAAFAVVVGFLLVKCDEKKMLSLRIENTFQHSLEELYSGIRNIEILLEKAIYVNSPARMAALSADIIRESAIAKSNLSALPSNGQSPESINRFLTQAGDFSASLTEKIIAEGGLTDDDRQNLINLQKSAAAFSDTVGKIIMEYEEGGMWHQETAAMLENLNTQTPFGDTVYSAEDSFTSYPSLLYDGPFSDHILKTSPKLLENGAELTKEKAAETAANFLNISLRTLKYEGLEEGKIRAYRFSGTDFDISVSVIGGHIIYYRKYRPIGNDTLSYNQAVEKAVKSAEEHFGETFAQSYYIADEGMCTVNLAYKSGNTVCYTDLVKIGIAMDTGELILWEATGYIMNHTARSISEPKYTSIEAEKQLSERLKVISVKDVLIPSPGSLKEYHCYEFYCNGLDDKEILIYIDTDTLTERDIQIMLRTDGGIMAK